MRKFNVNVNGTSYEVEVEEIVPGTKSSTPKAVASPVQKQAPTPTTQQAQAKPDQSQPKVSQSAGKTPVNSPMPGTINKLNVSVGQNVKKGQTLLVLETMKMENDIQSPCDGTVASINVAKGSSVSTGQLLITIN